MKEIGKILHYFSKIGVAVIELTADLKEGDIIHFRGHTSDFSQEVKSMQIDHKNVLKAVAGQEVGMKVDEHVREHDRVYFKEE